VTEKSFLWCPRGIKSIEEHEQQFLTHRWVPGQGVTCMEIGEAFKYDQAFPPVDHVRRPIPPMGPMPSNTLRIDGTVKYDFDKGELNIVDDRARVVIEVRKKLEDDILIKAVIFELEKRGYTVISPEEGSGE
jgi:hypothetical protein